MKKIISIYVLLTTFIVNAQVGIGVEVPSAMLDLVSEGNTSATKALRIENSSGVEIVTVLDNGNVGINVPAPSSKLHTNGSIKYENLPVVTGTVSPLAIKADGTVGTYVPQPTKYLYMEYPTSSTPSSFPLSSTTQFTNFPLTASHSEINTISAGFGTDGAATLDGSAATNVNYISFPEPGVYKINLVYYTACSGTPNTTTDAMLGIGTVLFKASSGTAYTKQAVVRYNALPRRNDSGSIITNRYNFALPHTVFLVFETTAVNEKIALFVNYGFGDTFTSSNCSFAAPLGLDNRITMNISKL